MRTLTFTLNTQTGNDEMAPATVTITEQDDGSLLFDVTNVDDGDNLIGDLRSLFFDVSDDTLLGTLSASGSDVSDFDQSGDVDNLGNGATSSGVPDSPYEVGVEFGTAGMSADDIQTTSFTLTSFLRDLTLDDIALESFTVRQTSVGDADGDRSGSDKLYGDAPYPVDAIDDVIEVDEDAVQNGNLFANDVDLDAPDADGDGVADLNLTAIDGDGGLVGQVIEVAEGVTLVVNEDGSYTIDASDADYLSAGEVVTQTYEYAVDDGNGGSDTASIDVTVNGVNDTPVAAADTDITDEDSVVSGNVLTNDSDIDQLDTISVSSINGDSGSVGTQVTLDSGALLTLNADGTYSYDPNGAFDHLNDGETAVDSFTYAITDDHDATASTTVEITIEGIGETTVDEDHFGTFSNKKGTADHAISNIVLYLEGDDGFVKVKVDDWDGGETDLDNVDLSAFLSEEFPDYELVGVSIKAGNNHNRDLGPGEGQMFLLDGDEDVDYVAGGDVPDPLTAELLEAHADHTYSYNTDMFS
jgi:hypothetical protein